MGKSFNESPTISDILTRLGIIEGGPGYNLPSDWEDTKVDIRAIVGYNDGDFVGCFENDGVYQFDAAETTSDDDNIYLTPDDITEPAAGRWVKQATYSIVGHLHTDYVEKPGTAGNGNLAQFDSDKNITDSGKSINDFQLKEAGKGLSANDFTDTLKDKLDNLPDAATLTSQLAAKMDKLTGLVAGDVGDIVTLDVNGNAVQGIRLYSQAETGLVAGDNTITLDREMPDATYFVAVQETTGIRVSWAFDQTTTTFKVNCAKAGAAAVFRIYHKF